MQADPDKWDDSELIAAVSRGLARAHSLRLAPRTNRPRLFFSGAVQTKTHGPGLYEPSRVVLYSCWKNRSREHDFFIRQTESVLISVNAWEVEKPVDSFKYTRDAEFCVVPEGKIGSYGHRSIIALMLGCVPLTSTAAAVVGVLVRISVWRSG